MPDIAVPKLNNNDDTYLLVDWLYDDGQEVRAGEPVAVVETSKAAADLVSEQGGVLHRLTGVREECRPGDVIGRLFASEEERLTFATAAAVAVTGPEPAELVITDAARALIAEHGIAEDALRATGRTVIRGADVAGLVSGRAAQPSTPDRAQRAVARVVSAAHREIPAAFTVVKVDVGAALALARRVAERTGGVVGLPDVLVAAVAGLRERFPVFHAEVRDGELVHGGRTGVGVTVDVGRGLNIPVVPATATGSVAGVAAAMMDLRVTAMRGAFQEGDFAGAGIVVSLSNDAGVLFTRPIIFPGHTCMLSLGGTCDELALDAGGSVRARQVAHVGITYDHRFVNGRDAVLFLQALTQVLESPEPLDPAGDAA